MTDIVSGDPRAYDERRDKTVSCWYYGPKVSGLGKWRSIAFEDSIFLAFPPSLQALLTHLKTCLTHQNLPRQLVLGRNKPRRPVMMRKKRQLPRIALKGARRS